MKNFLLIFIFLVGIIYYFVPYETKVSVLNKIGIDSSFLEKDAGEEEIIKGEVIELKLDMESRKLTYNGNISNGKIIDNSLWASQPYVKCFYPKDYNSFSGNVAIHRLTIPKNRAVTVKLTQEESENNLNMYVYKTTALNNSFPPEINYVHACEINITTEQIKAIEMKGNTAPTDIVIGVSGGLGVSELGYSLEIEEK